MRIRHSFFLSIALMGLLALPAYSNTHPAIPTPNRDDPRPPGVIVRPAELEFSVPQQVADSAQISLENTGNLRIDYSVSGLVSYGWAAQYYRNAAGAAPQFGQLVLERVDSLINFDWGNNAPAQQVPQNNFGVRWTGTFFAHLPGTYNFRSRTDDGCRLYVNGQRIIDDWRDHGPEERDGSVDLPVGMHRAVFEYYENGGGALAQLSWNTPDNRNFRFLSAFNGPAFLNVPAASGRINARETINLTVRIYTDQLESNTDYERTMVITTTDRINPRLEVPVRVRVGRAFPGGVTINPDHVFIALGEGERGEASITLRNPERGNYNFMARKVGQNTDWLTMTPMVGRVGPEGEWELPLQFNSQGLQVGLYSLALVFANDNMQVREHSVPVTMAVGLQTGSIMGTVRDAGTRDPIANARVALTGHGIASATDGNGRFHMENVPVGRYRLWSRTAGYLRWESEDFELGAGGEAEVNPMLLHGEFDAVPPRVEAAIEPNDTMTVPLRIRNRGNGPLTWQLTPEIPGGGDFLPWQRRATLQAGQEVNDNRLAGVAFDGEFFYVAGGNNGQQQNFIYVLDREGDEVRRFRQPVESIFGMRDLTWDGNLLWGIDGGVVYGMNRQGEVEAQFNEPLRPSRVITWDTDRNLFWIGSHTTDIYGIDREGREVARLRRPEGNLHVYGLGYYPEDPDGFKLYLFTNEPDGAYQVHKVNTNNGQVRRVIILEGIEGRPGGCHITGIYDPYQWVLIGVMQSDPNRVGVWQLGQRTEWLRLAPVSGTVNPGQSTDISILLNSRGLPPDLVLNAGLNFRHDGFGGAANVPLRVTVTEAGGVSQRLVNFELGWSLVSVNVAPEDNGFLALLDPLREAGVLLMAKDEGGRFYWPERDFNQIENWEPSEGYWVKLARPAALPIVGAPIPYDRPIPLAEGWNIAPYLPRQPVDAPVAVSGIREQLVILRDGRGRFYIPEYEFSNIGELIEGRGYQIKASEDVELVYNLGDGVAAPTPALPPEAEAFIASVAPTSVSYSLLVLGENSLPSGARLVALTADGLTAGAGVVGEDGRCGLALWGDDPTTAIVDGFRSGEPVQIKRLDGVPVKLSWLDGEAETWTPDGWGVARVGEAATAAEFELTAAWPNPFNNRLSVSFSLTKAGLVKLAVYDVAGRQAAELWNGQASAGSHTVSWAADTAPSGIYLLRLESARGVRSHKVTLIK